MKQQQFWEEQIIGILKEAEAGAVATLCEDFGRTHPVGGSRGSVIKL